MYGGRTNGEIKASTSTEIRVRTQDHAWLTRWLLAVGFWLDARQCQRRICRLMSISCRFRSQLSLARTRSLGWCNSGGKQFRFHVTLVQHDACMYVEKTTPWHGMRPCIRHSAHSHASGTGTGSVPLGLKMRCFTASVPCSQQSARWGMSAAKSSPGLLCQHRRSD